MGPKEYQIIRSNLLIRCLGNGSAISSTYARYVGISHTGQAALIPDRVSSRPDLEQTLPIAMANRSSMSLGYSLGTTYPNL